MPATALRRAIGIIRVSQPGNRSGPSFHSPKDQRNDIAKFCADKGWHLVDAYDELHVSGNALLEDRPGLSRAVTAVLTGAADIIVGAHAERLWWSHEVRAQVLRLVEGAGGEVWSVDSGCLSNGSAAEDFTGEVRTSADRFSRRQNAEKSRAAVVEAVASGVIPFGQVPPPLRLTEDGRAEPVPEQVPVVNEAVRMRADGATINDVRAYLRDHGIERSYHGVASMLSSKLLLGEVHFGELVNLHAFPPVVDRDVWRRAQRTKSMPGRRAKSARLLARLGVLRCESCGARMVVGSSNHGTYPIYRCPPNNDCARHVTISAELVEGLVVAEVRRLLADVEGAASAAAEARDADAALSVAQDNLDAAIRTFTGLGLEGETSATERLAELSAERDRARELAESLSGVRAALTVTVEDWDRLTLTERRGLIRATLDHVTVAPGRGADRVTIKAFGQ
jgi:DNA invertase Pin-like site-specific DNA recombinase